jgi:hypothetical protein
MFFNYCVYIFNPSTRRHQDKVAPALLKLLMADSCHDQSLGSFVSYPFLRCGHMWDGLEKMIAGSVYLQYEKL